MADLCQGNDESICLKLALEELTDVEAEDGAIAESECKDILQAFVKKRKRTFADTVKGKTWKKNTGGFSGSVYKGAGDGQHAKDTRRNIEESRISCVDSADRRVIGTETARRSTRTRLVRRRLT